MKVENLKDTSEMMCSSDYKERFKAEYYQLRMRFSALDKMLINYMSGRLSFNPSWRGIQYAQNNARKLRAQNYESYKDKQTASI